MSSSYLKFDYKNFNRQNLIKILDKFGNPKKLKILFLSTYKSNYTRTETLRELFDSLNIKVEYALFGESKLKYIKVINYLIKNQNKFDIIFLSFRGQEIFPLIKFFSNKPIIFDAFVSMYDTLCFDRKTFSPYSFIGRLIRRIERWEIDNSSIVLVDTKAYKQYFEKEFKSKNIDYLYLGCNEKLFKPIKVKRDNKQRVIFWYGLANPLQGVDIILKSAKLLENNQNIMFRLVGPIKKKYSNLIKNLKNVEIIDYIPYKKLPIEINKADICFGGHFSDIEKGKRVIAGKTFQFLACEKPTIIGENPANREIFKDKGLVHYVKMNDEKELAKKILEILR